MPLNAPRSYLVRTWFVPVSYHGIYYCNRLALVRTWFVPWHLSLPSTIMKWSGSKDFWLALVRTWFVPWHISLPSTIRKKYVREVFSLNLVRTWFVPWHMSRILAEIKSETWRKTGLLLFLFLLNIHLNFFW